MSRSPTPSSSADRVVSQVVSGRGPGYVDPDVGLRYVELAPGETRPLGPSEYPRLLVLGRGHGGAQDRTMAPGDVVVIPPDEDPLVYAGPTGLDAFEAKLLRATGSGQLRVEPRVRLAPFHEELIVAPAGAPFRLDRELSLAEVLVPPGVTTSQHELGVDERYLMLSGPATMFLGDRSRAVGPGDVVAITAGTRQSIRNESSLEPLRLYCLCTPSFEPATYRPGPVRGHGPEGFSLDAWWNHHRSDYEGPTP